MRERSIILLLALASLIIGFLLLPLRNPGSSPATAPAGVLLSFHGVTNVSGKGNYAVFSVTNAGFLRTSMEPDGLLYRNFETWSTNSLRNQRRDNWIYWYRDTNGNLQLGNWYDFGGDLQPGAAATFGAPVLVTNAPWRLSFYCVERAAGFKVWQTGLATSSNTCPVLSRTELREAS